MHPAIIVLIFNWVRTDSHKPLLSNHSLLDVLCWVQPLTVLWVSRRHKDGAILTHLVGKLRPGALWVTIVVGVGAPLVVGKQVSILLNKQLLKALILQLTLFDLLTDFIFKSVSVLRNTFSEFINDDSFLHTLRHLYIYDRKTTLFHTRSRLLLYALDCTIDQVLILRNWLLLQPYIQLVLNELHLEVCTPWDTLVVSQHTFRFEQCRNALAPAQLQAHAQKILLS